jgi:prepilin-type N-terminal cleavage/methylation domain-containing protein
LFLLISEYHKTSNTFIILNKNYFFTNFFMKTKKQKKAFTLIELLVSISLISILAIWISSIDYNRLNNKAKLDIFTNEIKTHFERVRNNALSWKWIWTDLNVPEKWRIEYSLSNSWKIISKTLSWTNYWLDYENINFNNLYEITNLDCLNLNQLNLENINSWTWIIEFSWINISLTWSCTNSSSKILELTIKSKSDEKILQLNTMNWLAEIK